MTNFEALGFAVCILCALAGGILIAGLLSSLIPLNFGANLPAQVLTLSPLAIALVLSLVFRNRQRRGDQAAGILEEIE